MNELDCLPPALRGTITPLTTGLSGARVFRVEVGDRAYVLKVSTDRPVAEWRRALAICDLAAGAGLAPAIVHIDEERKAIVTDFVVDRSFPALYFNPATHDRALALLGTTLSRVHALPLPADAPRTDPRTLTRKLVDELAPVETVPAFVLDAARRALAEEPPAEPRLVTSHNDVNPGNLIFDGERLLLLDWDVAGANEPYYDLAAIAVFLRMDDAACSELLAAYNGTTALPPRFLYDRRLVAALCGAMFLRLARGRGYAGEALALDAAPSLPELFQRVRAGAVDLRSPAGGWLFGLALAKASLAY